MSLNAAHAAGGHGVVIFNGERILIYYDGCELTLKPNPPASMMSGTKKGRVYLTSHRIIFVTKNQGDPLQSFSMAFLNMKEVDIKQPIFGANRIDGIIKAEPDGKWQGSAQFSLTFTHGGAIEFGQALLEAGRRATQNRAAAPPPPYYCPPPCAAGYYSAPPPAYAPAYQDPYYNFVPQHSSFGPPPQNDVFVSSMPPPYPGVGPTPPYFPPNQAPPYAQNGAAAGEYQNMTPSEQAKAQEASYGVPTAGYYDPNQPHSVYAPPPYPPQTDSYPPQPPASCPAAPPAYDSWKKQN